MMSPPDPDVKSLMTSGAISSADSLNSPKFSVIFLYCWAVRTTVSVPAPVVTLAWSPPLIKITSFPSPAKIESPPMPPVIVSSPSSPSRMLKLLSPVIMSLEIVPVMSLKFWIFRSWKVILLFVCSRNSREFCERSALMEEFLVESNRPLILFLWFASAMIDSMSE